MRTKRKRGPYQSKWNNEKAKRLRLCLILVLCDGTCPLCGNEEELQVEHPKGAGWEKNRYNSLIRVQLYWKEFWANVPLRVLCRNCNQRLSMNGKKKSQMFLL